MLFLSVKRIFLDLDDNLQYGENKILNILMSQKSLYSEFESPLKITVYKRGGLRGGGNKGAKIRNSFWSVLYWNLSTNIF